MNTDKLLELVEKVRDAELFEDGVRADLFIAGVHTIAAAYMRGRQDSCDELAAALRAEQAVGEEQIARELAEIAAWHRRMNLELSGKGSEWAAKEMYACRHGKFAETLERALGTARQSEGVVVPNGLRVIGELLRTQDNRITDSPIFIVQQKREHVADPDYDCDRIVWVGEDNTELSAEESAAAEEHFKAEYEAPEGLRRLAVRVEWEFVTACFTEQGCKDYLARDGHNLKEPRIYAAGSYRNEEFRAVRKFLMSLAAAPGGEGEG